MYEIGLFDPSFGPSLGLSQDGCKLLSSLDIICPPHERKVLNLYLSAFLLNKPIGLKLLTLDRCLLFKYLFKVQVDLESPLKKVKVRSRTCLESRVEILAKK